MSRTLFFYVARLYVLLTVTILGALTLVYLVVDFGDRLGTYMDHPLSQVARLYGYKALRELYQLAPAALLLAGGTTVSIFRRRSEWIAMQAAGASRWVMVLPIALSAVVFALGLMAYDEVVVTRAGTRVDQIMANDFNRWGDYRFFYFPKQWFRVGQNMFQVRGQSDEASTLKTVSIFTMSPTFHLDARVDADEMQHVEGSTWRLRTAVSRQFSQTGESTRQVDAERLVTFEGTDADTFRVRVGRPELMRVHDILDQQETRAKIGLPTQRFWLALHNRFAYPMTGVGAAMLAVALALRPTRRGHLTLAIVEGLLVAVLLFALMLIGKTLVLGERVPPFAAAWAPMVGLLGASAVLWSVAEGRLSRRA